MKLYTKHFILFILLTNITKTYAGGSGGGGLAQELLNENIALLSIEESTFSALKEELLTKDADISIANSNKKMSLIKSDDKRLLLQSLSNDDLLLIEKVKTRDESNISNIEITDSSVSIEFNNGAGGINPEL